jgi:hypothetical protein
MKQAWLYRSHFGVDCSQMRETKGYRLRILVWYGFGGGTQDDPSFLGVFPDGCGGGGRVLYQIRFA